MDKQLKNGLYESINMKAVFLIPPSPDNKKIIRMIDCAHETKADYLWQPNDYIIMSSLLRENDEAVFIDGTANKLSDNAFFNKLSVINNPDIIFFALSSVCWGTDYNYFQKVKKIYPNVPIFVFADIFLEKEYRAFILKEADGIILNPYDIDLDKMKNIRNEKHEKINGICISPEDKVYDGVKKVKNCSVETFPRHEMFLNPNYRFPFAQHAKFATVTSVLGCPFNCSYCATSKMSPVVRRHESVVKELEYLEGLGVKELFFNDKSFGFPRENSFAFLKEMVKRFNFSWSCYFSPQLYESELLDLMKKAGCHTIIIGIDSANFESLFQYNRKIKQDKSENLVYHASKLNMNICADFIIGLDHESEQDILNTIEYSLKLPLDYASFNIASPLPGSSIRERAIKEGKITVGKEGFDTLGNKNILGSAKVSADRLYELRKIAIKKFYLRPGYILKRLRKIKSLEHLGIQTLQAVSLIYGSMIK